MVQKTLKGDRVTERRNMLMAIQPRWADAILSGEKKWEYRRVTMNIKPGARLFLYATGELHAIVGEVVIEKILNEPIDALIEHTMREVLETPEHLREAFAGHEIGHALKVKNPIRYKMPFTLAAIREQIPRFVPPQGFYYVTEENPLLSILPQKRSQIDD